MAVDLGDLMSRLRPSLNVPGDTPFFDMSDDSPWIEALANAFWWARSRGFFTAWRIEVDGGEIVPIEDGGDDMPEELWQIVVAFCAVEQLGNKYSSFATTKKDSARTGLSTERQYSATLLKDHYQAKRQELEDLKELYVGTVYASTVGVIDQFLARDCSLRDGRSVFVG